MATSSLSHLDRRAAASAQKHEWPQWAGRAGLVGRGLLHLLVGWIAIRIARGNQNDHADQRGALTFVARQPLGRVLVIALAVLFAGYALWRLLGALIERDDGAFERIALGARGVLYAVLSFVALSFALKGPGREAHSSSPQQHDITARVLGWPGGRFIIAAVGLGIIAVGLWQGYRAVTEKFTEDLKQYEMSERALAWTKATGMVGSLARMVAFSLCGWFVLRAAWESDPSKPVGLDASLHAFAGRSWGPAALWVVGLGLVLYGLYAISLARYERVLGR